MYTPLYNRLCGWLFFALGTIGFAIGHVGSYIRVSLAESILYLCLGFIGMAGARLRHRDCSLVCVQLGLGLFLWGIAGFVWPRSVIGSSEPLESAIRVVAGLWGMYAAVTDVLDWRSRDHAVPPAA